MQGGGAARGGVWPRATGRDGARQDEVSGKRTTSLSSAPRKEGLFPSPSRPPIHKAPNPTDPLPHQPGQMVSGVASGMT